MTPRLRHPALLLGEDFFHFRLLRPWYYEWPHKGRLHRLQVPAGFVTDLASVPRPLRFLIDRHELLVGALPHDLIYQRAGRLSHRHFTIDGRPCEQRWSRRDADRLFSRVMREAGVAPWRRRTAYRAVRVGGWLSWQRAEARVEAKE